MSSSASACPVKLRFEDAGDLVQRHGNPGTGRGFRDFENLANFSQFESFAIAKHQDGAQMIRHGQKGYFVGGKAGSDPAAVAFDAVDAGINRGKDVVIVDTAGRLHTSGSLMDEMKKIDRVIGKRLPGAPHETLLVLDGTIGQNAVQQAKTFSEAINITGLVVTKVDGTAKGGIVLAVHDALNVPVKFIGIGEKATDLEAFDPKAFAHEVLEA